MRILGYIILALVIIWVLFNVARFISLLVQKVREKKNNTATSVEEAMADKDDVNTNKEV